jgi:hypothetical protein
MQEASKVFNRLGDQDFDCIANIVRRNNDFADRVSTAFHNDVYRGKSEGTLREIITNALSSECRFDSDIENLLCLMVDWLSPEMIASIAKDISRQHVLDQEE